MDTLFWYKLLQSFLVGSIWITASTLIAEKYGSKIGGFIGGLPSTIIIALLFIGITQSPEAAVRATTVVPLTMGINGIFTLVYLVSVKRGLITALFRAFLVWIALAGPLAFSGLDNFPLAVTGWLLLMGFYFIAVEKFAHIPAHGKVTVHYTTIQIVSRGLFAGILIAFAVFMSKLAGPVLGGIFAVFPVIFTSTMVITYHSGGYKFSRAVVKILVVSAMVNVGVYAIAVRYTYSELGLGWGTLTAIGVSLVTAWLTFYGIRKWLL
ncbi:MAG: DUF3147 family protein [Candidatus Neomarinimicrobiota bacterium]